MWMVLADGRTVPLGAQLTSASPAEVVLAESTLAHVRSASGGKTEEKLRRYRRQWEIERVRLVADHL